MRPCTLHFLTVPDLSPIDAIQVAAEAGYEFVSLRLQPPHPLDDPLPLLGDATLAREVAKISQRTGVGVAEVDILRLPLDLEGDAGMRFVERAASLGARHLVAIGLTSDEAKIAQSFSKACRLAAPYGMTVNLEPISWQPIHTVAQAQRVLDLAAEPNGGILIDALHFNRMAESLSTVRAIEPKLLNIFHLCDAGSQSPVSLDALRVEARTARQLPSEGQLPLSPLLHELPSHTLISVEIPNQKLLAEFTPLQRAKMALKATRTLFRDCL